MTSGPELLFVALPSVEDAHRWLTRIKIDLHHLVCLGIHAAFDPMNKKACHALPGQLFLVILDSFPFEALELVVIIALEKKAKNVNNRIQQCGST